MKKVFTILLGVALLFSMIPIVSAEETSTVASTTDGVTVYGSGSSGLISSDPNTLTPVPVIYSISLEHYRIVIPSKIDFTNTDTVSDVVTVSDVTLTAGSVVNVTIMSVNGWELKCTNLQVSETLSYTMTITDGSGSITGTSTAGNTNPISILKTGGIKELTKSLTFNLVDHPANLGSYGDDLHFTVTVERPSSNTE